MCRACNGAFPTTANHASLRDSAKALREAVSSGQINALEFARRVADLDQLRFAGPPNGATPELGQPLTASSMRDLIYCSPHPHALTLFVLACWYDAQEQYVVVWSRRLKQLAEWVASEVPSEATLPSARSGPWTRMIAWKTWTVCGKSGFADWMAKTVLSIAKSHRSGKGNTYRFIGRLAHELTTPGQSTRNDFSALEMGRFAPAQFKRAWMLLMFLRRDQGVIRCFVERSLAQVNGGADAAQAWYDDSIFPQSECELPVDKRMFAIGAEIFGGAPANEQTVMELAHEWGRLNGMSPSALDSLFFAMD